MSGTRKRSALALACCAVVVLSSCTGTAGQATSPSGAAAINGSFSDQSVAALGQAFATEGVATYDSATTTTPLWPVTAPSSPLKLLRWQLRAMALEASASGGGGVTGQSLDLLYPVPKDVLPASYFMAGYVTWGGTPGSRLVAALMGQQDWKKPDAIVFPTLAVMMMVADVSRAAANPSTGSPIVDKPTGGGNACTTLAGWVDQVIASIFNALTVGQSNNSFLNILGSIWNAGVGLLEQAVRAAIAAFTAPVVLLIKGIVTVVGVGAMLVSFLQNMKLTSTASPPFNRYSGLPGTVTFTLGSPSGFDWPPDLVACATAVGLPLQSLNARNNDKVTWSTAGLPPFAQMVSQDPQLDANNSATFAYVTGNENVPCGSKQQPDDVIRVTIKVQRAERDKLKTFIRAFVDAQLNQLGQLGQLALTIVGPPLHALLDKAINELTSVVDPTAQRFVRIEHHAPQPCPSASPSPSSPPSPTTSSVLCALLFPFGVPSDLLQQVGGRTPQGLPESACEYGPPNSSPSQEVATAQLVLYPTAQAARSAFEQGMSGASRLSGIGDAAALTTVDCQMPTDDENVKQPGVCGAVVKGSKLVFIASRLPEPQVTALLRIAASHM